MNRIAVPCNRREPYRDGENAESIDFKPDMASGEQDSIKERSISGASPKACGGV